MAVDQVLGLLSCWRDFTPMKRTDGPKSRGREGTVNAPQSSVQQPLCEVLKSFQMGYTISISPKVWVKCFPLIFLFFQGEKRKTLQLPIRKVSSCFNKIDWMNSNMAVLSVMSKKLKKKKIQFYGSGWVMRWKSKQMAETGRLWRLSFLRWKELKKS